MEHPCGARNAFAIGRIAPHNATVERNITMTKRVLIVDDEWRTLQGEAQRVKTCGLDVEVVGLAENAAKALALVHSERPDIILCDIHMPDIDGIAFTIQAKDVDPNIAVIFISGYSDREYLRTAIRIGVIDYLFKPVNDAEFLSAMRRAIERSDLARRRQREETALIDQTLLRTLLHSNDEALLKGILPDGRTAGHYIVVYAAHSARSMREHTRQQFNMFALHMMSTLSQSLALRYTALREEDAMILLVGQETAQPLLTHALQAVCEAMFDSLPEARAHISIGIGRQFDDLLQANRSFTEAVEAQRLSFFRGAGAVILHSDRRQLRYAIPEEQVARMLRAIEESRMLSARDQVDVLFARLKNAEATPIAHILGFAERIADALAREYARMLPGKALFQAGECRQWLEEISTLDALQKQLQGVFTRVADDTLLGHGGQSAVYNAMHYIWANVHSDLSIKAIAAHVYLSPTYFCALFKNVMGQTVNQYIQQVRIERAQKLLDESDLSIYEVARAVGYQGSRYFAKVFVTTTGLHPSAYRKRPRDV